MKFLNRFFGGDKEDPNTPKVDIPKNNIAFHCLGRETHSITYDKRNLPLAFILQCTSDFYTVFLEGAKILHVIPPQDAQLNYRLDAETNNGEFLFLNNIQPMLVEFPVQVMWVKKEKYNIARKVSAYFSHKSIKVDLTFSLEISLEIKTALCKDILEKIFRSTHWETLQENSNIIEHNINKELFSKYVEEAIDVMKKQIRDRNLIDVLESPKTNVEFFREIFEQEISKKFSDSGFHFTLDYVNISEALARRMMDLSIDRQEQLQKQNELIKKINDENQRRADFSEDLKLAGTQQAFQSPMKQVIVAQMIALQQKKSKQKESSKITPKKMKRMRWKYRLSKEMESSEFMDFKRLGDHIVDAVNELDGASFHDVEVMAENGDIWLPAYSEEKEFIVFRNSIILAAERLQVTLPEPEKTFEYMFEEQVELLTVSEIVMLINEDPEELHMIRSLGSDSWEPWEQIEEIANKIG